MLTYDPAKKAYRGWWFGSGGECSEANGQWDEDTKTMTWKAGWDNGATMTTRVQFLDRDSYKWALIAKNKDGKVLLDMQGTLARRKSATENAEEKKAEQGPPELKV